MITKIPCKALKAATKQGEVSAPALAEYVIRNELYETFWR